MFVSSLAMHLGLLDMTPFIYSRYYLFRFPPQIWRCITGFLITGPQLGLMFDTYFFYNSCSALETGHPRMRRKEDLIWYFFFIIFAMLVGFSLFAFGFSLFTLSRVPISCHVFQKQNTSYICPGSALPLQLSRFLEMRKSTPVLLTSPSFAISGLAAVQAWWDVSVICSSLLNFLKRLCSSLHFFICALFLCLP